MKQRKIYSMDRKVAAKVNLAQLNPTVRAIVKGLWTLSKDKDFIGATGDAVLEYCVENRLWNTKQDRDKYITTWAYYVKTLKSLGIVEAGYTGVSSAAEFLIDDIEAEAEDEAEVEA